jgi:hypothetical protein
MSQLIERVVGRMIDDRMRMTKGASGQSFDSVSNMEDSAPGQYVTNRLKHTGEDYEKASVTSYGLQQTRDLLAQGPNSGPLTDKASSDQPDDRSSEHDIKDNPLYDVFHTPEEPTDKITDPGTQGDTVSEKLQLKKDAALLTRMDDVNEQGRRIIDYLMQLTVRQKQAGLPGVTQPGYTQDELITEAAKLATSDAVTQVKTALLHVVDDAIYAAEAAALEVKKAESEPVPASPPATSLRLPKKAALEDPPAAPPAANVGGGQAMAAMSDPAPPDGTGDAPPISEEEAQALMAESLQENGVDPSALTEAGPGGEPNPGDGTEFTPEELDVFIAAMQQAGITPEEVDAAIMELHQEGGAGIAPEEGMLADDEAAKTGHYKFASFVKRPAAKTAQQEQRAAMIRGAVRDFVYGPSPKNFP